MTDEDRQDSAELLKFIEERGYVLHAPETRYASNVFEHPQLDHVELTRGSAGEYLYNMWDPDGNHFSFQALEYNPEDEEIYEPQMKKLYKRRNPNDN